VAACYPYVLLWAYFDTISNSGLSSSCQYETLGLVPSTLSYILQIDLSVLFSHVLVVPSLVLPKTEGIVVWEFLSLKYRYECVTDVHLTFLVPTRATCSTSLVPWNHSLHLLYLHQSCPRCVGSSVLWNSSCHTTLW
jgi:hypothetical protein